MLNNIAQYDPPKEISDSFEPDKCFWMKFLSDAPQNSESLELDYQLPNFVRTASIFTESVDTICSSSEWHVAISHTHSRVSRCRMQIDLKREIIDTRFVT